MKSIFFLECYVIAVIVGGDIEVTGKYIAKYLQRKAKPRAAALAGNKPRLLASA